MDKKQNQWLCGTEKNQGFFWFRGKTNDNLKQDQGPECSRNVQNDPVTVQGHRKFFYSFFFNFTENIPEATLKV